MHVLYPYVYCTYLQVRFVKGDDIYLSPYYDPVDPTAGFCAVTLTIYAPEERALYYFNKVYATTRKFNARFHWGKHFNAGRSEMKYFYPKFEEFAVKRKAMDPKGIFINEFLEETFQFELED